MSERGRTDGASEERRKKARKEEGKKQDESQGAGKPSQAARPRLGWTNVPADGDVGVLEAVDDRVAVPLDREAVAADIRMHAHAGGRASK